MQTISLCMIVRDEEKTLARCLDSVQSAVDEVIIVDTGSTDRTIKIASEYNARVYDLPWIDDFAYARNFAFSKAEMDYQMWLDADDILPPGHAEKLITFKENMDGTEDVVMMPYCVSFDAAGRAVYSYHRERLLKREKNFVWEGAVHEVITPSGRIVYADIEVHHKKIEKSRDADRNLTIYRGLLEKGHVLSPREQFYYGSELYFHALYAEAAQVLSAFLDSGLGWVENNITACRYLHVCHKRLDDRKGAFLALFRSFTYDLPRAEVLCDIGALFMEAGQYDKAIYWYERATACQRGNARGGFSEMDCYDYIPYLQLCVCYDRLGKIKEAMDANERALRVKPDSEIARGNRAYFLAKR